MLGNCSIVGSSYALHAATWHYDILKSPIIGAFSVGAPLQVAQVKGPRLLQISKTSQEYTCSGAGIIYPCYALLCLILVVLIPMFSVVLNHSIESWLVSSSSINNRVSYFIRKCHLLCCLDRWPNSFESIHCGVLVNPVSRYIRNRTFVKMHLRTINKLFGRYLLWEALVTFWALVILIRLCNRLNKWIWAEIIAYRDF